METVITIIIAIAGWVVAWGYAIKQVEVAHNKNTKLQKALLIQNEKANIAKEFLKLYSDIFSSLYDFKSSLSRLHNNMAIAEKTEDKTWTTGWLDLVDPVNHKYTAICKNLTLFEAWISVAEQYLPNSQKLRFLVDQFKENFTYKENSLNDDLWMPLQVSLAAIKINKKPDSRGFKAPCLRAIKFIDLLDREFKIEAKKIQDILFFPKI